MNEKIQMFSFLWALIVGSIGFVYIGYRMLLWKNWKSILEDSKYYQWIFWPLFLIGLWNWRGRGNIDGPTFWEKVISGDIGWLIPFSFAIVCVVGIIIFWWKLKKAMIHIEKTKALLGNVSKK